MHLLIDWLEFDFGIDTPVISVGRAHLDQAFSTVVQHKATHQIYLDTLFSESSKKKQRVSEMIPTLAKPLLV